MAGLIADSVVIYTIPCDYGNISDGGAQRSDTLRFQRSINLRSGDTLTYHYLRVHGIQKNSFEYATF
jgi:hypothetical protein